MERLTIDEVIYCLKAGCEGYSEVCEECPLYEKVGCDHCYDDATDSAINALEELKAYKDAEEDGLLIRLPFAIGTPIYKVCFSPEIKDGFVYEGTMTLKFYADNMKDFENGIVYASKEEAEQALAKMKGV